ncbi:MAG: very short patch repair endonuclease [Candidatus Nanoarchaeia archaeon]|nr:very short patch repair endonuclease [Candidatus Nanoarchaeia archaeon]
MPDNLTKKQRSYCMSRIKSKWTTQEKKIHNYLKANKIKHKMHPSLFGRPDIILKDKNRVIFLQGCFWHKCPLCYIKPKSNKMYWLKKIERNVTRDKNVKKLLRQQGYEVICLWGHEIKNNFEKALLKVIN